MARLWRAVRDLVAEYRSFGVEEFRNAERMRMDAARELQRARQSLPTPEQMEAERVAVLQAVVKNLEKVNASSRDMVKQQSELFDKMMPDSVPEGPLRDHARATIRAALDDGDKKATGGST